MQDYTDIRNKAALIRKWCLVSTTEAESGHPTSCLSAADIATLLFDKYFTYELDEPLNIYNDRFVLSKGHAAPLLYSLFGMAGAYPMEQLKTLRKFGSQFEGHPVPRFKYTEAATGSLGQGLSVGAGLALVAKRENLPYKTYVLMGDGELAEGQVWEAANFASYQRLDNLVAILDINRLAQSGETMFGHNVEAYVERFRAFGFEVVDIDGHDFEAIDHALNHATTNRSGRPFAIVARTVKGKGISFLEDKEGWHGKALKKDELAKALQELGTLDDNLNFKLKTPERSQLPETTIDQTINMKFERGKAYATREVFGEAVTELGKRNRSIFTLDGDVKNSTFTQDFMKALPERFVECFIAEQNMVSVAVGLARVGKVPFVTTFAAFLTRAADQVRMARVSEANLKFVGSHVGVSIGEDGPSQMGLEDIALFGALPDTLILQPADAISTAALVPIMAAHKGFAYMRTMRSKTDLLYKADEKFKIGGSKTLKQSDKDQLVIAATGVTVVEAMKAAEMLAEEDIAVRVIDIYSINPIDAEGLEAAIGVTELQILITVEDHFVHGGMGDFAASALAESGYLVAKMGIETISESGSKEELMKKAGIDAQSIVRKVKEYVTVAV